MSTTVTIEMHTHLAELHDDIKTSFKSEADSERASTTLANSLASEGVQKRAYEDVKHLSKTIGVIKAGFRTVRGVLVQFDAQKFKNEAGNVVEFASDWDTLKKNFDDIVQQSQFNATEAINDLKGITSILDFDIDVPEDKRPTFDHLKAEVDNILMPLKEKGKNAVDMKQGFQQISDRVKEFSSKMEVVLTQAKEAMRVDLETAQKRVNELQRQLEQINMQISSLTRTLAIELTAGAGAGLLAFFTLSPVAVVAAVTSVVSAIKTGKNLTDAKAEQENLSEETAKAIEDLKAKQRTDELLQKYSLELSAHMTTINNIAQQIDTIQNIWHTIALDLHALSDNLTKVVKGPITPFFWAKMQPTKKTYISLTACLEIYIEQVAEDAAKETTE